MSYSPVSLIAWIEEKAGPHGGSQKASAPLSHSPANQGRQLLGSLPCFRDGVCEVGHAPKSGNSNGFPRASPDSNSDLRHTLE